MRHGRPRPRRNAPTEALTSLREPQGRPPGPRGHGTGWPTPRQRHHGRWRYKSAFPQLAWPVPGRGHNPVHHRRMSVRPGRPADRVRAGPPAGPDPTGPPTGSRQHGCRDVHQARPRVRTAAPDGPTAADDRHHQQSCPDEHPDNADPAVHDGRVPGRGCAQTVAGNRIIRGSSASGSVDHPDRSGGQGQRSDRAGQPAVGTWPVTR
jgi:hypothetical protein